MHTLQQKTDRPIAVRDLYPELKDEELKDAEETLDRYISAVLRIYERIRVDPVAYAQVTRLTGARSDAAMEAERSNNKNILLSKP